MVFVLTLVVVGAILTIVFAPLYEEVRSSSTTCPATSTTCAARALLRELDARYDILAKLQDQATTLPARLPDTAGAFLGFAGAIFSAVSKALTVIFLTVFLLLELPAIGRSILSLLAPPVGRADAGADDDINATVARYVAGALVIATLAGTTTLVASTLLGVPFPVVMAVLVAMFDLIPLVGASIGGASRRGRRVHGRPRARADHGGGPDRLPAGREQRAAAGRDAALGERLRLHGAAGRAGRLVAARRARRAARDPGRGQRPDRPPRGAREPSQAGRLASGSGARAAAAPA